MDNKKGLSRLILLVLVIITIMPSVLAISSDMKDSYQQKKSQTTTTVSDSIIKDIISSWTGIPITKISQSETEKLTQLEKIMHQRLVDQENAVEIVASAVRRGRAGLKSTNRPIGSFVFLGPTGVGKTELAKTLAEVLFGQEEAMIRFDMTEFMEKHAVARLIGAPPGYVGYEQGGVLTEAVRRRPYQVILFDEVEKAHHDVFNILLQVLDDGRLTDSQGHVVNFTNSIIILTSNLGSQFLTDLDEEQKVDDVRDSVMEVVRSHFRPEFLNRLDEIILFNKLSRKNMEGIVDVQFARLAKRLSARNITLEIDKFAKNYLSAKGYDSTYGARPLKRVIQRDIENVLAEKILRGEIKEGQKVAIKAKGESLNFEV